MGPKHESRWLRDWNDLNKYTGASLWCDADIDAEM